MSEDSFVTTYERTNFSGNCQAITDLYDTCQKLHKDVSNFRKINADLEGALVEERNLKSVIEQKYQTALQDIEHYKIKKLIDKNNFYDEQECEIGMDYENIYTVNEENIKKNLDTELKNCELESRCRELEDNNCKLKERLSESEIHNANINKAYEDLRSFVETIKSELSDINNLKFQLNEIQGTINSSCNSESTIYSHLTKIDELQVKCHNMEKENKKFKENHMNLLLLMEENTSLTNQIKSLEEKLAILDSFSVKNADNSHFESNIDQSIERRFHFLERENEILKSQQMHLVEKNSEFSAKIGYMTGKINSVEESNRIWKDLDDQRKEQMALLESQVDSLTRECESYKNVLYEFSEQQFSSQPDVTNLLSRLNELCSSIELSRVDVLNQAKMLDHLSDLSLARLEKGNEDSEVSNCTSNQELGLISDSSNQKMILELRQQVEHLYEELDLKTQLIEQFTEEKCSVKHVSICSEAEDELVLQSHHYTDMGFSKSSGVNTGRENQGKIFKNLTEQLLEAIRKIMGFSLELGPNGYFTVQSCFSHDPSHLLEFKIENHEPVLLDNAYSLSVTKYVDFSESFPVLLARITLDLIEKNENLMS